MPTFTMPRVPGLDFSKLDLSKVQLPMIDLSKFDLSKVQFPKFDLPKFDLPKVDLPKVDLSKVQLPKFDLPKFDVDRLGDLARDAAYIGVGLVAMAVQKVDERRRGVQTELTTRASQLVDAVA
jgi:hypothetical protein